MHIKRLFIKKIFILQIIFTLLFGIMLSITLPSTKIQAVTQTSKVGIDAFPESYKAGLNALKAKHPNWNFTAFFTNLNWQDVINGETQAHPYNRVYHTSDSAWKCSCGKPANETWVCASAGINEYFIDPRNFLTETGIFQFMEMSYNPSIHTKQGVESIVKGSFMDASITVTAEREDDSIKAKADGAYIYVAPGAKNSEVAKAIGVSKYKVTDSSKKTISNDANAATGYIFTNTEYNTSYTIVVLGDVNGDGQIKATDYVKIKNYIMEKGTLSNIEKKAADVNGDGQIKATDYVKIKNYIMIGTPITLSEITSSKQTMRYAEIIMKAADASGISPYSIATKIIQEVGRQGSGSVSGNYPGYEGYYNFFNWGASDGNDAIAKGLEYAKGKGWNNQYTSIVEGSKQMADNYVSVGQNTAYFYKFNVISNSQHKLYSHQYMTNVQDPSSQANNLFNTYAKNDILDLSLNFIIPVYNNMPAKCLLPTTIDPSLNTSYYINGTDVRLRSSAKIEDNNIISVLTPNEVVTLVQDNAGTANGHTWVKIKRANGSEGFVAKEFIKKCGT